MTVRKRWRWERDQQVCCSTERCTACLTLVFCLSQPLPLPVVGWRDRRRRLAEAIFTLATNAMIGNQKAVPKLKMVLRLMSKFMHEPGPLARYRSRMHQVSPALHRGPLRLRELLAPPALACSLFPDAPLQLLRCCTAPAPLLHRSCSAAAPLRLRRCTATATLRAPAPPHTLTCPHLPPPTLCRLARVA